MKPYCTYITQHETGFSYIGKGRTSAVVSGAYKGSGVAFKAALKHPKFGWDTWTTHVIDEFDSEDEAYAAEAVLVTIEALRNPFLLNSQAGGRSGRNQNRSTLVRRDKAAERSSARAEAAQKRKARELVAKEKLKSLRQQLRSKK